MYAENDFERKFNKQTFKVWEKWLGKQYVYRLVQWCLQQQFPAHSIIQRLKAEFHHPLPCHPIQTSLSG